MSQGIRANPRPRYHTFYWLAGLLTAVLLFVAGGAVGAATPAHPPNTTCAQSLIVAKANLSALADGLNQAIATGSPSLSDVANNADLDAATISIWLNECLSR